MGFMENPRSKIIAISLAAAAILTPTASHAQDAAPQKEENGLAQLWGHIKKAGSDIKQGISQGVDQATNGTSVGEAIGRGVNEGVNANLTGQSNTPKVLGYVDIGNRNFITYFDNNKMGFQSSGSPLSAPPKAGTVPPPFVVVPKGAFAGQALPNNIDQMKTAKVFVTVATANPNTPAARGNGYSTVDADGDVNCRVRPDGGRLRTDADFARAAVCQQEKDARLLKQAHAERDAAANAARPAAAGKKHNNQQQPTGTN